jgi:hypothetical protein
MKKLALKNGGFAQVSDEDYERVLAAGPWSRKQESHTVYAQSTHHIKHRYLHRFIMDAPADLAVDHRDHDGLNNQRGNLRIATDNQNSYNQKVARDNNTSGYKGVTWHKALKKWQVMISANGKQKYLGVFKTAEEASEVYKAAAQLLHKEFACIN